MIFKIYSVYYNLQYKRDQYQEYILIIHANNILHFWHIALLRHFLRQTTGSVLYQFEHLKHISLVYIHVNYGIPLPIARDCQPIIRV